MEEVLHENPKKLMHPTDQKKYQARCPKAIERASKKGKKYRQHRDVYKYETQFEIAKNILHQRIFLKIQFLITQRQSRLPLLCFAGVSNLAYKLSAFAVEHQCHRHRRSASDREKGIPADRESQTPRIISSFHGVFLITRPGGAKKEPVESRVT